MERRNTSFASQDSHLLSHEGEGNETKIELTIESIENIIQNGTLDLKITVEHEDALLGQSELIKIISTIENSTTEHPINFTVSLPYVANDAKSINSIVSTPILIKVFDYSEDVTPSQATVTKRKSKRTASQTESRRSSKIEPKIIGMCNVDLLPLVLGEKLCTEKLILEIPSYTNDNSSVSWANLPRLSITMTQDESELIMSDMDFNILNITVESIYNVPTHFNKENMDYKCATVLNIEDKVEESCIVFENGKWTDFRDVTRRKAWKSLQNLESRARFSKYNIDCDIDYVKNDFKKQFDLKAAVKQDKARIEWNVMHRAFLERNDIQSIHDQFKRYRHWPFEVEVSEKQRISKQEKTPNDHESIIYQCYVDASQLLFPGRSRTRILTQLHSQNIMEMEEKTGLRVNIFGEKPEVLSTERSKSNSASSRSQCESQFSQVNESLPLFTDNGEPVLILIELELYQPLTIARVLEDYTEAFEILKCKPKLDDPIFTFTPDLAHDQYMNCIAHLVDVIGENYKNFLDKCECKDESQGSTSDGESKDPCRTPEPKKNAKGDIACPYAYIPDHQDRFKQYLHETGIYDAIHNTLRSKIINLMDQKFVLNSPNRCCNKTQNKVCSIYTYLVEQMHIALNKKIDTHPVSLQKPDDESPDDLWFRSEEAYEFDDYDKAEQLLTKMICQDQSNPDSWLRYAFYLMKICCVDEAIECCREAIRLNSRHTVALLFYGINLAMREEYRDAEIFLKAVTNFYPRFAEGWAILHLFYVKIQYYPGIDLTLQIAEKCLKDRFHANEHMKVLDHEPVAWSASLCRSNKIFMLTAVLLLKMNLHNFAELALSQELCHNDKSIELLYFLAVNNYSQYKYEDSLKCLSEAEVEIGLDYSISSLLGHFYYKRKNIERAIEQYESVDMMYDRPENILLVHLRMGFHLIEVEEFERARNVFLRACKHSPTAKTWLGVGIASFYLEKFEESELALTEANRIDCQDPEVWGYLCLLNISLQRYEEFTQCYKQMVQNNLRNDKLWRLITQSMETLGYTSPIIVLDKPKCVC